MGFLKKHLVTAIVASCMLLFAARNAHAVDATIDVTKKHQTIEGFGGGFMFGVWPYGQPYKDELYDSIFNKAGVNIVRVANFYDPETDTGVIPELPMMKEVQALYPDVKVMMASWSPPKYLKEQDTIAGKLNNQQLTIKKADGQFMYAEYADYWLKSVKYFQDGGLKLGWISIQNEPDWPADYEGCLFTPTEGAAASYGKALTAVYDKIKTLPEPPPFIGPDMTGPKGNNYTISQYVDNIDLNKIAAVSHHFYNGETEADMKGVRQKVGSKTVFQTEWLTNEDQARWDGKIWSWFDHLQVVQRSLTIEDVSMYLIFALAYKTASTHCFFSQDTVAKTYQARPIYYGFKHFSKSIKRGMKRVDISASSGLQISAFASDENDRVSVVVINTGAATKLTLKGIPATVDTGCAYQTTKSGDTQPKKYEEIARFGTTVPEFPIDGTSVTSIELWNKVLTPVDAAPVRHTTSASALRATLEQGTIAVHLPVPSGSRYSVSLFNASGKRVSSASNVNSENAVSVHRFTRPAAAGVYLVVLDYAGTRTSVPVVVK